MFELKKMNNILISVPNKSRFISKTLYICNSIYYNRLILSREYKDKLKDVDPLRKRALTKMINAIEHNSKLFEKIVDSLKEQVSIDEILKYGYHELAMKSEKNDLESNMVNFKFLKRDWCGTKKGEEDIKTIVSSLKEIVHNHIVSDTNALFLGAGLGRVAWELTTCFKKVYAIDKSYPMAFTFNELLSKDITFFEINESKVFSVEQSAIELKATLSSSTVNPKEAKEKFEYVVGDVISLPFDNESFSLISSVYFTDVIPLNLYIKEIKRVMKTQGIFVHFGPLFHFFSEIEERLTSEEIMKKFEEFGFETVENRVVKTNFLPLSSEMSDTVIKNWLFVARLVESKDYSQIGDELYCLKKPIKYVKNGYIGGLSENIEVINSKGKSFVNAEFIIEILNCFDNEKRPNEAIANLSKKHDFTLDDEQRIKDTIMKLIDEQFLIRYGI